MSISIFGVGVGVQNCFLSARDIPSSTSSASASQPASSSSAFKKLPLESYEIKKEWKGIIDPAEVVEKWVWIGTSLPGRETTRTFDTWDYKTIPRIRILQHFAAIKTWKALKKNLRRLLKTFRCPQKRELELDNKTKVFLKFTETGLGWALDKKTRRVYRYHPKASSARTWVAESLPEFLTRVWIENAIWRKAHYGGIEYTERETTYLDHYARRGEAEQKTSVAQ